MKGTFEATVIAHKLATSKNKGTPSVNLKFELNRNVDSGEECPPNTHLYADQWLTDDCFDRTMHTLTKTLSWDGDDLSDLNGTCLVGNKAWVVVEEEEYEGVTRSKIKWVNEVGSKKGAGSFAESQLKNLNEKLATFKQLHRTETPKETDPVKAAGVNVDTPF